MEESGITDDTIVRFETSEAVRIKFLFERLTMYEDCCLKFSPSGITSNATNTHIVLALLNLPADKLDSYFCKREVLIGIEVNWWFDVLKRVNQDDTIVVRIRESEFSSPKVSSPSVRLFIYNRNNKMLTNRLMPLLNISMVDYSLPQRDFQAVISIPAQHFRCALKHCENAGDSVRLFTANRDGLGTKFYIETDGDLTGNVTIRLDITPSVDQEDTKDPDDDGGPPAKKVKRIDDIPACNKQDRFTFKLLDEISKSVSMNPNASVVIYLAVDEDGNEFPIVLDYLVGTMGTIRYIVAPKMRDENDRPATDDDMCQTAGTCDELTSEDLVDGDEHDDDGGAQCEADYGSGGEDDGGGDDY